MRWEIGSPEDFVDPFAGTTYWLLEMKDGTFIVARYYSRNRLSYLENWANGCEINSQLVKRHIPVPDPN